jgi:hypothetical protein
MLRYTLVVVGLLAATAASSNEDQPAAGNRSAMLWTFVSSAGAYYKIQQINAAQGPPSGSITVWVQGDHSRDASVPYRRSFQRVTLDCAGSYQITAFRSYTQQGRLREEWDHFGVTQTVRAGSFVASLQAALCR